MGYSVKFNVEHTILGAVRKMTIAIDSNNSIYYITDCSSNVKTKYQSGDLVNITLYNVDFKIAIDKLFLISALKIKFPKDYGKYINDLLFFKYDAVSSRGKNSYAVYFSKPVEYAKDTSYRLIPYMPAYAINKEGKILEIDTGIIKIPGYLSSLSRTTPYTNVGLNGLSFSVHRLLASAWIENDEPYRKFMVDHINADPTDNRIENLRWVTLQENNAYVPEQGKCRTSYYCTIKNIVTGEFKSFYSATMAAKYMGTSRFTLRPKQLINGYKVMVIKSERGVFQVKSPTDDAPWIEYEDWKYVGYTYTRHVLTIYQNGKMIDKFNSMFDVCKALGLNYIEPNAVKLKELYQEKFPDRDIKLSIELVEKTPVGYIAKNTTTGEIVYKSTVREIAAAICVAEGSASKSATNQGAYEYNGWKVKADDGYDFKETPTIANKPNEYKVTDLVNNTVVIYPSLRATAKAFKMDKKTLIKRMAAFNGIIDSKYKIELIK